MKRLFDNCFSFLGLVLLLPLFILIAILIKIDSSGPIFFKQERIGRHFKPFFIYKFRTMIKDGDRRGLQITVGGDNRITRIGRLLRKAKLDEFPQLINVLMGEMSLVGPRPEVKMYVDLLREDYMEILKMRPGITDISSITFRHEEEVLKNQADPEWYYREVLLPEKIKLAREYVKTSSVLYDLKLIFNTLRKIFSHSAIPEDLFLQRANKNPQGKTDLV
jgi:lipopolysaccharide/colanic/teichoic acid biosynthesis glycosyltransferase